MDSSIDVNRGQQASSVGASDAAQSTAVAISQKPLTAKEEKQLNPGSKEFGVVTLVALGAGSGALAGVRFWIALLVGVIVAGAISGRNDLLSRSANHPSPSRSDGRQLALFGAVWLVTVLLFTVGSTSTPNEPVPDSTSEEEETESSSSATPDPDAGQVEEHDTVTDEEPPSLSDLLSEVLGSPNRDVSFLTAEPGRRVVLIEDEADLLVLVALNDNLSSRLIRSSAQRDTVRVAETMQQQPDFDGTVTLSMYFPLVDQFGNAQETVVATVSYTRETLDRINFSNLVRANIWDIADARQIHSVLSE